MIKRDSKLMKGKSGKLVVTNKFSGENIHKYLLGKSDIFDIGSGPEGSYWWKLIDKNARIVGIDTFFFPRKLPPNVKIYKYNASLLCNIKKDIKIPRYKNLLLNIFIDEEVDWVNKFDMVVANHVLEHVESVEDTIKGISTIMKRGGVVYVGFPDYRNFIDIFYHVLFPDGGGHIQKIDNVIVNELFEKNGFKLTECNIWPTDWSWLKDSYEAKKKDLKYLKQEDFDYLAETFSKELSFKKGYFYGWEMVFKKI